MLGVLSPTTGHVGSHKYLIFTYGIYYTYSTYQYKIHVGKPHDTTLPLPKFQQKWITPFLFPTFSLEISQSKQVARDTGHTA